jgi:hypothetical protein
MKARQLFILLLLALNSSAQIQKSKLVGDWKSYLSDSTTFEFLRLNQDGTGLKCFGQTLNGKDSLFPDHVTTLHITNWRIKNVKLILDSKNTVSFKVNPEYSVELSHEGNLTLSGEHLIFHIHPSYLNRNEFQRIVTYQRAEKLSAAYGVNTSSRIEKHKDLFTFKAIDSVMQLAVYKGFDDLIPHIVACNYGFEYVQRYKDPPYELILPRSVRNWSFGSGNKMFYIRFDTHGDSTETSIVIYYDFSDQMKNFYFSEISAGKEKENIIKRNNLDVYKTMNWEGKYEGNLFYQNSIIVAYYTRDEKLQESLQKCITSLKYR